VQNADIRIVYSLPVVEVRDNVNRFGADLLIDRTDAEPRLHR
jgi:hypothetical protein